MTSMQPDIDHPSPSQLLRAASKFRAWVQNNAPGATVFLCGGLALAAYGSTRQTTDADLAIDLSNTQRPKSNRQFDTNSLKHMASGSPDFVVGPKIYWILDRDTPDKTLVQVDFVDAKLYWNPFSLHDMVNQSSHLPLPCLNLPTLLVGKIKSATERSQADRMERVMKQVNDVSDSYFVLTQCVTHDPPLTLSSAQIEHLGHPIANALATVSAFFKLKAELENQNFRQSDDDFLSLWSALIIRSGLPQSFIDVSNQVTKDE